jgi:hypothetical protein
MIDYKPWGGTMIHEHLVQNKNKIQEAISIELEKVSDTEKQFIGTGIETRLPKAITEVIDNKENDYSLMTVRSLEAFADRYDWSVELFGGGDLKDLKQLIKSDWNHCTSGDWVLVERITFGNRIVVMDVASVKCSVSDTPTIALWNDKEGSCCKAVRDNETDNLIGNVIMIDVNTETNMVNVYHSRNKLADFTSLFGSFTESANKTFFHGTSYKGRGSLTKYYGSKRQVFEMRQRGHAYTKKDGTPAQQTSFNRGLHIDKRFLSFLADHGYVDRLFSFQADFDNIEKTALQRDYPNFFQEAR